MNPGPLLFLGAFFALATSWLSFVLAPQVQLGRSALVELQETGTSYPPARPGTAAQGARIYRANGCFYCHSQQVRDRLYGTDTARGWGDRAGKVQSVAQDYLYDSPVMLGSQRVGPDLANLGAREKQTNMLFFHIYDARIITEGSLMPPFRYLFATRELKAGITRSPNALPENLSPKGVEIIPSDDARALVDYLLSLHSDGVLFETPPPPAPKTNAVAGPKSTNAPTATNTSATIAPATNSPAK